MSPETKDAHGLPEARRSIEIDMASQLHLLLRPSAMRIFGAKN
jgi:hypothetical protein